jgi:hypothetical protein
MEEIGRPLTNAGSLLSQPCVEPFSRFINNVYRLDLSRGCPPTTRQPALNAAAINGPLLAASWRIEGGNACQLIGKKVSLFVCVKEPPSFYYVSFLPHTHCSLLA